MSSFSLYPDASADVEETAVPRMNDTTEAEKEYYKFYRLWRLLLDDKVSVRLSFLSPGIFAVLGLPVLIVGVWALVQGTSYFSIAMLPTTSLIIVSVLLIIVGLVILLGGVGYILFIRFSGTLNVYQRLWQPTLLMFVLSSLSIVVVTLGITAASLIPSLSETTQLSANATFSNYLSDQSVQKNFNDVQDNLKCCGVVAFTDYESIFNNLSVPVSCCNTTSPHANETTCPKIVSNAQHQQANQTSLIYSGGCVPQLQSVLQYSLSVVAGVSITFGLLKILVGVSVCIYIGCLMFITTKHLLDKNITEERIERLEYMERFEHVDRLECMERVESLERIELMDSLIRIEHMENLKRKELIQSLERMQHT